MDFIFDRGIEELDEDKIYFARSVPMRLLFLLYASRKRSGGGRRWTQSTLETCPMGAFSADQWFEECSALFVEKVLEPGTAFLRSE